MEGKKRKKKNFQVQNIVATASLKVKVPLSKLVKSYVNTEYNPEQFPGLVLRIKKPKSAVLVFSSGNLVCTGTKSVKQVNEVIKQVIKHLRKIGIVVKEKPKIEVQNIVASGFINMRINLNELALMLENTEYEPEQFPGLVYKLEEPNATFLLFTNGKLVCTGTKNRKELEEAMKTLLKRVREIKRGK
ncbi:MAG TPA: TATA-box-binding protein [Candidatus Pacearchaeota archaeon]|nr:TATA-box-binding protein [Candidatus Pacearchaeota archaeon]